MIPQPSEINNSHQITPDLLDLPPRLLLGPGPTNVPPRVLQALSAQPVGHLDPAFLEIMDEIQEWLRYLWQTDNELTIPISGTGSAAMEASLANPVEPGDVVLVAINGYFGQRLAEMARRYGAEVHCLEKRWGEIFSVDELRAGLEEHQPTILALVQGETSTGARQPLTGLGALCREFDCLLLVDAVASLGGVPFLMDEWQVDIAYSGSQKCLSCPPGLSPLSLGPRALAKIEQRQTPVANWYLDVNLLRRYWGSARAYHHTAPVNLNYALHEGLRLIASEGLSARWQRHQESAEVLWEGLADLGLECHVPREHRLVSLTTVRVPEGVEPKAVTRTLLEKHNIEIANGLGQLAGKVWRIGLMGYNSRTDNVYRLLAALESVLGEE